MENGTFDGYFKFIQELMNIFYGNNKNSFDLKIVYQITIDKIFLTHFKQN